MTPFTILGEIPDGGPGSETANALRSPITPAVIHEVLCSARDLILTATGPRDGVASPLNVHQFDQAIRAFMPAGHYERAPNQAISVMDYKMYACRVVQRLLHQATGRNFRVAGQYNSHLAVNAKANALYETLLDVAASYRVPSFVRHGWEERLGAIEPLAMRPVNGPEADALDAQREDPHPDRLRKSTIGSPVQAVFAICDAMTARDFAVTRTALVDECIKQGVAFYTAQTQVSVWRKKRKYGKAPNSATFDESAKPAPLARSIDSGTPSSFEDAWAARRRELEEQLRAEMEERLQQELKRMSAPPMPPNHSSLLTGTSQVLPEPSWAPAIGDASVRRVLVHLSRHGAISETELVGFLGSPRAARQFSAAFEQHLAQVPFLIRIEQLPDGKRYVKEEEK